MQQDPTRNKAGTTEVDRAGRHRFASYGSTTADGLRAMLLCSRQKTDPRPAAAIGWLTRQFNAAEQPGRFAGERQYVRNAGYYYYCWSVSKALRMAEVKLSDGQGEAGWAGKLSAALIKRQRKDGSWANEITDLREDDPLIATSLAVGAIRACREAILNEQ